MPEATLEERFWAKVKKAGLGDCWEWQAGTNGSLGYGKFEQAMAHRVAYELLVGPIPEGLELDHLCRNPPCVNPAHLDPVTHRENCRRGRVGAWQREKTHCPQGHPYKGENLYVSPTGARSCRTCSRKQHEKLRQKHIKKRF